MLECFKNLFSKKTKLVEKDCDDYSQEEEKEETLFKRYVEEYEIEDSIKVGKLVVELKVENNNTIYHHIKGVLINPLLQKCDYSQDYDHHPTYTKYDRCGQPLNQTLFSYSVGFTAKIRQIDTYLSEGSEEYSILRDKIIQEDLLYYVLGKEHTKKAMFVEHTDAKEVYHKWVGAAFKNKVFLIKDEYYNPDKVISCKIFSYDEDFKLTKKRKAFKVLENKNETWLR